MQNPYRPVSKKQIYKNPWITVHEDIVIDERSGKEKLFGVVDIPSGASCLPIDTDGNVYLINTYCYALGRCAVQCVAGSIEGNETSEENGRRELEEELGITGGEWISLGHVYTLTEIIDFKEYLFLIRVDTLAPENIKPEEGCESVVIPLDQAVEKVMNSEIVHGPSVALIMKANEYLKK